MYTQSPLTAEAAAALYKEYYKHHPFVHVTEKAISLKEVVNTNTCKIHIEKHKDMLYITSVIDNLLKGASGTAGAKHEYIVWMAANNRFAIKTRSI